MPSAPTQDMTDLIREQIEDVLRNRGGLTYLPEDQEKLEKLDAQVAAMLQDRSLGRILNGPLWLSGASVLDGTVTADKISVNTLEAVQTDTGTLNVTGNFTAAASYPALTGARVVISSAGVKGYNAADAATFNLLVDGSGFIGIGGSQVSWNTSGVVTVPAAAISSLTIADIGSGTFNNNFDAGTGRVRAGTTLQRVEITSAGLAAYNTGGTQTFLLSAANGSLTHTGVHTIRNASSGARVELSNVGLRGYNSSGVQTFGLSTSDGSGFLGVSGGGFSWSAAGTVVINGSLLVSSTITSDKLNVGTLSAISANAGTITAGTISAGTVTTGTLAADRISGGSLGGSFNLGGADMVLNSTGKISWASSGSYLSATKLSIQTTGFGTALEFKDSTGTVRGSIYASTAGVEYGGRNGNAGYNIGWTSGTLLYDIGPIDITSNGTATIGGGLGVSVGVFQSDGNIYMRLGDSAGADIFYIRDSSSVAQFGVNSNGDLIRPIANDATALGAYYGRVPIYINGSLKYLAVYN